MNRFKKKSIERVFRRLMMMVVFVGFLSPVYASKVTTVEIDKWVEDVRFQFQPDLLQPEGGQSGNIQGYYNKTPGFPLWLMMDMGGAVLIDKEHFSVNSASKDDDGVWLLNLSCVDSVNGFFLLDFAVDSKRGNVVLKVATAGVGVIAFYQGKILPYEGPKSDFKSEKQAEKAKQTVDIMDSIIPGLNFTVKFKSELYGNNARIFVTPENLKVKTAKMLNFDNFNVICCEKQNDMWYVRLEVGEATVITEEMYIDLAINATTRDVNYRYGFADQLKSDWRIIVDGKVQLP